MRTTKNNAIKEIKLSNTTPVEVLTDDIRSMAKQNRDTVIGVSGRRWKFPGAQIETDSWEVEWSSDGKVYLHDGTGNVVEGTELSDAQIEQMHREEVLADVLELAAAKLRSGGGWDEVTTADVLSEIEHATNAEGNSGFRMPWRRQSESIVLGQ